MDQIDNNKFTLHPLCNKNVMDSLKDQINWNENEFKWHPLFDKNVMDNLKDQPDWNENEFRHCVSILKCITIDFSTRQSLCPKTEIIGPLLYKIIISNKYHNNDNDHNHDNNTVIKTWYCIDTNDTHTLWITLPEKNLLCKYGWNISIHNAPKYYHDNDHDNDHDHAQTKSVIIE